MEEIGKLIPSVLADLQSPEKNNRQKLLNAWESIVGEETAKKTKPSLTKDGKVFIWVSDSAVAFEINQKYRKSYLKRIQGVIGENVVKQLYVRVGQLR
jgi:hypothetical protein